MQNPTSSSSWIVDYVSYDSVRVSAGGWDDNECPGKVARENSILRFTNDDEVVVSEWPLFHSVSSSEATTIDCGIIIQ